MALWLLVPVVRDLLQSESDEIQGVVDCIQLPSMLPTHRVIDEGVPARSVYLLDPSRSDPFRRDLVMPGTMENAAQGQDDVGLTMAVCQISQVLQLGLPLVEQISS
jgi:hypothetical protein